MRTCSPHPPLSLRGGKSAGIWSFLHSLIILVETVIGSSYLLKSEALMSLIWNRYLTRLHEKMFTFWSYWTARWGWFERRSWRGWPFFHPLMRPVVLLNVVFLIVEKSKRVQQLVVERCNILPSGFNVLNKARNTGASSAIFKLYLKCTDWYNLNECAYQALHAQHPRCTSLGTRRSTRIWLVEERVDFRITSRIGWVKRMN